MSQQGDMFQPKHPAAVDVNMYAQKNKCIVFYMLRVQTGRNVGSGIKKRRIIMS